MFYAYFFCFCIIFAPANGVEPSQRPCRARNGVGLLSEHLDTLDSLAFDICVASLAQYLYNLRLVVEGNNIALVCVLDRPREIEVHTVGAVLDQPMLLIHLRSHQYFFH